MTSILFSLFWTFLESIHFSMTILLSYSAGPPVVWRYAVFLIRVLLPSRKNYPFHFGVLYSQKKNHAGLSSSFGGACYCEFILTQYFFVIRAENHVWSVSHYLLCESGSVIVFSDFWSDWYASTFLCGLRFIGGSRTAFSANTTTILIRF